MKTIRCALSAALLSTTALLAQADTYKVDIDVNTHQTESFFAQPWVWIVGGAVFLLLLVALLRGGRKE